jgi:hypothetical protein
VKRILFSIHLFSLDGGRLFGTIGVEGYYHDKFLDSVVFLVGPNEKIEKLEERRVRPIQNYETMLGFLLGYLI